MAKKLGFGLMRLPLMDPNDGGSIDMAQLKDMVDKFLERGFTYFDTAWMYCEGKSECAVKEALTLRHPRESFTVTSKLPSYMLKTKEDRDKIFFEQLNKTGLQYFDYYLLHAIGPSNIQTFRELDCFGWLQEKKAAGLIGKAGFSFHGSAELLDEVLTEHPEVELVQLQINYLDWESEKVQSRLCHEVACKHGKQIIIMEPVKGGTLANVPEAVKEMFTKADPAVSVPSWAVRFAAGLDNVFMVLSGMSNMDQLLDNTGYMQSFVPLDEKQLDMVHMAAKMISGEIKIPCTSCFYCTAVCPMNIAIPQYFALYNRQDATSEEYSRLDCEFGKASDCIVCGQCEKICPQQLSIRKLLRDVAERFE